MNNSNDLKNYLNERNIDFKKIENKIIIDQNWKQMIYDKYKNQIKIDKVAIENELRNKKLNLT